MSTVSSYSSAGQVSRRRLLRGAVVTVGGLAGAAMVGCSSSAPKPAATAAAPQAAGTSAPVARKYPPGQKIPIVAGKIKDGGTFTEGATTVATEFDSHTGLTSHVQRNSGDLALLPDQWTGELVPNLVESWEVPDPTTFILKLRDNVALHDIPPWNGRIFNVEDLAFNFNRIAGNTAEAEGLPKAAFQRAATMNGLKSVEIVDKSRVKLTLNGPNGQFLSGLTDHRSFMIPKEQVQVGFKDPLKLAHTGQYTLTEFDRTKEVYTRFDKSWRGKPHIDTFKRIVIPDRAAIAAAFISKQTTALAGPTPTEQQTIASARPDALYYESSGYQWNNLRPNTKYGALSDARVRKAISLSLNFPEMAEANYGKAASYWGVIGNPYPEAWTSEKVLTLPGYNVSTKDKDIAEGVKMMTASGHAGGEGVAYEILVSFGSIPYRENSLRMQAQLQKIFPKIKIIVKPAADAVSFSKLQSGKDFQVIAYTVGANSAASLEAYTHYHTKGSRNYGSFSNAECDALLEKSVAAIKTEERKQILETWQTRTFEEWMPIWAFAHPPVNAFVQPNLQGFEVGMGPWSEWWEYYRIGDMGFIG